VLLLFGVEMVPVTISVMLVVCITKLMVLIDHRWGLPKNHRRRLGREGMESIVPTAKPAPQLFGEETTKGSPFAMPAGYIINCIMWIVLWAWKKREFKLGKEDQKTLILTINPHLVPVKE
jgi:hypothetical protein